jgi:hypothetical protein
MNKKIFISIIVLIIAAAAIFFVLQGSSPASQSGETGTLPSVATNTVVTTTTSTVITPLIAPPSGTTLTIGTPDGSVTMNNFYKTAVISSDQQTAIVQQSPSYIVDYNVADSSFTIGILSMPFDAARQAAESAFLESLGISEQDACKLKVYEGVPSSVPGSEQYTGKVFPLSFCASSTFSQ